MRTDRIRSLSAVLFGLALVLAACGGTDESAVEGGDDTETTETDAETEESTEESEGSTEPSALDESLIEEPVDLSGPVAQTSVQSLIQALTGTLPSEEETTCLLDITENDTQLTEVFNGFGTTGYELSPEGFTALTVNAHSCVAQETLVESLSALSILDEEEGGAEFSACMAEQIGDETNGDLAFTGLSALLVGFEIPEGARQFAFDAAVDCVTPEDLAEQVSFNQESSLGFTVEVDRQCVIDGLDDETIQAFWAAFILGEGDGTEVQNMVETCTETFDSGLAQELPEDFEPWAGTRALAAVDPFVRNGVYEEFPPDVLEDGVDYGAVLTTTDGEIVLDLYEEAAPLAVNNFVALARDGFYDATTFHRVLEGFMAQGGDPTGTGTGGPGYSFEDDETGLTEIDRRGLLAMANSGPNTNGSQFFITFEPADFLNGAHVVFGEVLQGDETLGEVDLRDPDAPTSRGEQIVSITITEG